MTDTMQNQIDEAYRLFARYTLGSQMAVCDYGCCISQDEIQRLKTTPLQCLDTNILYQYLDSAEGDEDFLTLQIRYLLPRILELLVMGKGDEIRHSTEIILNKLHCDNSLWRADEIEFLLKFANNYLQYQIDNADLEHLSASIIMFDNAKLPMNSLLKGLFNVILKNADNPEMIEQVMGLVNEKNRFFASDELNQKLNQFFSSEDFTTAYLNAIIRKMDDDTYDHLSEDEKNLYEVAFSVLSGL